MKFYRNYCLIIVSLLAGSSEILRGSNIFVGGLGSDSNAHIFTYDGAGNRTNTADSGGTMGNPGQIAIGADGNLYVAQEDLSNGAAIDKYSGIDGHFLGYYVGPLGLGNGPLTNPLGLAWGLDGKLYIADEGNGSAFLESYDGTTFTQVIAPSGTGLNAPGGIAFGAGSILYITDRNTDSIWKWDGTNLTAFTEHVNGSSAYSDVAIGTDGNLYATDSAGFVRIFSSVDGHYIGVYGDTGNLVQPTGLAFDSSGFLFVTDDIGIKRYNASGTYLGSFVSFDSNAGDQGQGFYLAIGSAVPEPSTFALGAIGLAALGFIRRSRAAR